MKRTILAVFSAILAVGLLTGFGSHRPTVVICCSQNFPGGVKQCYESVTGDCLGAYQEKLLCD